MGCCVVMIRVVQYIWLKINVDFVVKGISYIHTIESQYKDGKNELQLQICVSLFIFHLHHNTLPTTIILDVYMLEHLPKYVKV